jgi:uncharacterized metal-binding protein YceD (DUF177 family)
MTDIPLRRFHDLVDLPERGIEMTIAASPEELKRLAEWAGVDEVSRLDGRVRVRPESRTRFLVETEFEADIVQSCVVTLEPVHTHIARNFTRELHLSPGLHTYPDKGGLVSALAEEEDAPDEIESTRYDLAAPLREEFALAIDSYPRAPGVEFEPPPDIEEQADSPFAVLENLRRSH